MGRGGERGEGGGGGSGGEEREGWWMRVRVGGAQECFRKVVGAC